MTTNKIYNTINLEELRAQGYSLILKDWIFPVSDECYLTYDLLELAVNKFWDEVVQNLNSEDRINIMLKVFIEDFSGYRSIGYMQRNISKTDRENLTKVFFDYWCLKSDDYKKSLVGNLCLTYRILPLSILEGITNTSKSKKLSTESLETYKMGENKLVKSMDYKDWGDVYVEESDGVVTVKDSKSESNLEYKFTQVSSTENVIDVKSGSMALMTITNVAKSEENLREFTRKEGRNESVIEGGEEVFKSTIRKFPYMTPVKNDAILTSKFITMDLETREINGSHSVYCISVFDGEEAKTYFISDYKDSDEMLNRCLDKLFIRKNKGKKIYLHNFSNFDSLFLINVLHKRSERNLKPTRRDGKLIELKFYQKDYVYPFRDSLLILPASLKSLTKAFKVEEKGTFPHKIFKRGIDYDYKGEFPLLDDYYNMSEKEYNEIKNDFYKDNPNRVWNLREESEKYCALDVVSLYQVINKFSIRIFESFRINLHKYPSISSLAFAIFRSNYLNPEVKIPIITGLTYNFMKNGYTGGSVDVIIPKGEDVYRYDVSSLYPYVMKHFKMPVGEVRYFEGDPRHNTDKPFGVFEVEVEAPDHLKVPILQKRFKVNSTISTLSPLGKWKGTYFSEEIYNAEKYGYKFKIIKGYLFESAVIFSEYVDDLYALKQKADKNSPDYVISKLLLNSLYGRFGMSDEFEQHIILPADEALSYEISDDFTINEITKLEGGKVWLSYHVNKDSVDKNSVNSRKVNISVPIALAITAYGRIFMTQFKNDDELKLYYTDTDSIDVNRELDPKFITNTLGGLVLEYKFKDCVYLAPKVYAGITYPNIGVKGKSKENTIIKVKGYKNIDTIEYEEIKKLLNFETLKLMQEKFFKDYEKGSINITNQVYSLSVTSNKRKLVVENGQIVGTNPYTVNYNDKYDSKTNDSSGYDIN